MDPATLVRVLDAAPRVLERLLDAAGITLFVQDEALRYLLIQGASSVTAGAVLGKTDDDFLPAADSGPFNDFKRGVLTSAASARRQFTVASGRRTRQYELTVLPLSGMSGRPTGIVGLVREIADRGATARALHRATQRLRALMNAVPVGVSFSEDASCHRITGNSTLLRQFDADPLDNLSASAPEASAPGRQVRFYREGREIPASALPLQRAVAENCIIDPVELEVLLPNGRRWLAEVSGAPVHDETGQVVGGVAVTVDVTKRAHTETLLREADRRKDEFLATLAHELRNPLAPIRHAVELMKRAPTDVELCERSRMTIERQLLHMTRLIDDLLDVSRIRRDAIELDRQPLDLSAVLTDAIEMTRPYVDGAQHRLDVELPPGTLPVDGDPVRLHQVFTNILINACKYTPVGGRISVTASRDNDLICVTISDDGIGIPADVLPAVFDLFLRIDRASDVIADGLGIGLALVKRFVELHGGTVMAMSDGAGRGTRVRVCLPASLGEQVPPTSPATVPDTACAARRILVVEDNNDSAESLVLLLQMSGHEATIAADGAQTMSILGAWQPDVILMDLGLPDISGLELCRRIRGRAAGHRPLIIALTGRGQEDDRRRTAEAGFDAHLLKPVEHVAILRLIERDAELPA